MQACIKLKPEDVFAHPQLLDLQATNATFSLDTQLWCDTIMMCLPGLVLWLTNYCNAW